MGAADLQPALPRSAYLDDTAFAAERERIFAHQWSNVARSEDVPEPGDWLRVEFAGESLLLVRDADSTLRGFYNVCRHRGAQLVPSDGPEAGHMRSMIRCPYHAWTYGLDGRFRHAPWLDGLEPERFGLHEVALDTWGGFVFVHLDSNPSASLAEQLGAVPERCRRYPLDALRRGARIVYDVRANWKLVAENYNECYHCGSVHPELCEIVPAFRQGGRGLDWENGIPHRDGAWTFTATGDSARAPFASLDEYERTRHKGELIYPNVLLSLSADHVVTFRLLPDAPDRTAIVCDFLFDPAEMTRAGFDPSDAVSFWEVVNRQDWAICESVQRGMQSRSFTGGWFAPMEDESLDISRWYRSHMGDA
ncbi:MAG: aromatic ring-hydroxylating dioxygenase subunit alpha [Actinomycetia bacterium]|nr:aromatic ring-hydroxylating dioxygenase subunit alpha [Actinomycetes bacterium]